MISIPAPEAATLPFALCDECIKAAQRAGWPRTAPLTDEQNPLIRYGHLESIRDFLAGVDAGRSIDPGRAVVLLRSIAQAASVPAALTQPAPEPRGGWQPIETAPKDGSYILAANHGGAWIAHWFPVATSGYRFDQPWRSVMLNQWHMSEETRHVPPTHWMPLPAAPTQGGL